MLWRIEVIWRVPEAFEQQNFDACDKRFTWQEANSAENCEV